MVLVFQERLSRSETVFKNGSLAGGEIITNQYTVDCLDPIQSIFVCGKCHYKLNKKRALTTWMED